MDSTDPANEVSAQIQKHTAKKRSSRTASLGYTVHQGEDMLLIVSSSGSQWTSQKKGKKKKKIKSTKASVPNSKRKTINPKPVLAKVTKRQESPALPLEASDNRWGESLPEEVLVHIFEKIVIHDGAIPFLCRMAQVCRLWHRAATCPVLWRSLTISYCWIQPGKTQQPRTEQRIKNTINWLAENRFSKLQDFSLCHWLRNVDHVIQAVSQFSPDLHSLKLSHCTGLSKQAFNTLSLHCLSLQKIDLQNSMYNADGLMDFLQCNGSQIKEVLLTEGQKTDKVLTTICKGCCPNLELLEITKKLDSKWVNVILSIQGLQLACPKLKTFRLMNIVPINKRLQGLKPSSGFQMLEELSLATTSNNFTSDDDLHRILFASTKLRVLDLRGCTRITPVALANLPCTELQCFFWGCHFTQGMFGSFSSPKTGLHLVTQKWGATLQQLDIANHSFTDDDMILAINYLHTQTTDTLTSLNLSGTTITPAPLKALLQQTPSINYLNLSSCRYFPRGLKQVYRDNKEIMALLQKLE